MTMMRTYDQCQNLYPIRGGYANIRYPAGTSGYHSNENCEWIIQASENVTLTFTRFDMNYYAEKHEDYVAVYVGYSKVGQWDKSTGAPPVLNLRGEIKLVFRSGGITIFHGTGFDVYVQPMNI